MWRAGHSDRLCAYGIFSSGSAPSAEKPQCEQEKRRNSKMLACLAIQAPHWGQRMVHAAASDEIRSAAPTTSATGEPPSSGAASSTRIPSAKPSRISRIFHRKAAGEAAFQEAARKDTQPSAMLVRQCGQV